MVAEIRSFVTRLRTENATERTTPSSMPQRRAIERLLALQETILAPLRIRGNDEIVGDEPDGAKGEGSAAGDGLRTRKGGGAGSSTPPPRRRRRNSRLLPLELTPAILAALDSLDDARSFAENGVFPVLAADADAAESKCEGEGRLTADIRAGDRLLSSAFASCSVEDRAFVGESRRTTRADASLALLSLAMDDIGFGRMSSNLPMREGVTYWDCLKFTLSEIFRANSMCYSDGEANGITNQQIIDEALCDEGVHVIPLSDFPALMRCTFRMISTTPPDFSPTSLSWESLLLRLYHAAAVAAGETPFRSLPGRKISGGVEYSNRLATFSTVESHVLLPSCTGAASSTVKVILEACVRECCASCKQGAANGEFLGGANRQFYSRNNDVVPTWAVAGLVLLIMRARTSNPSRSSTGFGPRAVFRMASTVIRKVADRENDPRSERRSAMGFFGDDEVGHALKVLLYLSGIEGRRCRACREDGGLDNRSERAACDALKCSFYANDGQFCWRRRMPEEGNVSLQLGLRALSSYSDLVRDGLTHGVLRNAQGKHRLTDPFIADNARTWIDAANMILDERNFCPPTDDKAASRIPDGTPMAIVIIVVIFFEVPSSQDNIVRSIYDRLTNVASRIGNGSDESCFILLSILVWSLVVRRRSSIDVVRRKGGEDHLSSVFGPLCSLLSKSAQSRDQFLDGALANASIGTTRRLAHALAPLLPGREVVLAMAQKNMRALSTASPYSRPSSEGVPFFDMPSTPSAANDAVYLAIDCLCVLIERCHPSNNLHPDDCGHSALGTLVDIIVLQCPSPSSSISDSTSRVPSHAMSWMLRALNESARLRKLTAWVSRRLLRSCFVGLMKCTALEETEFEENSPVLLPTSITCNVSHEETNRLASPIHYDVPGLLRLAVTLYDGIAESNENGHSGTDRPPSHALLKPHLLTALLIQPDKAYESTSEEKISTQNAMDRLFEDGRDALQRGFNPDDESISLAIDGLFLVVFVRSAARMIRKKQRDTARWIDPDLLRKLEEYIYVAEKYYYLEHDNDGTKQKRDSPLPAWMKAQHSSIGDSKIRWKSIMQIDETRLEFKLFYTSLCDILIETLLQNWVNHQEGAKVVGSQPHEMSILLAVNLLLGNKRQAAEPVTCSSVSKLLLGELSHNSICCLLELSSQHLLSLLKSRNNKNGVLPEVDGLVQNVLDLCKVVKSKQVSQDLSSQCRILSSFWTLYCSLGDEESSQLLSSMVKEAYVEIGQWANPEMSYDISESSFSLMSITSSEDLDYHVRYLRGLFLSALSRILTAIQTSHNDLSFDGQKSIIDLLLQLLPQICQDLDSAFEGHSGGLTKRLMLLFLDTINKCIDAIAALFDSTPRSVQHQLKSSFITVHQAASIIWDVFRERALVQSSVIKGTLNLCIDKIPSMIRSIERVLDECIGNTSLGERAPELLDQCSISLMPKPLDSVAGSDKSDDVSDDANMKSSNYVAETDGNENKVLDSSKKNAKEGHTGNEKCNVSKEKDINIGLAQICNISTPETLRWACNCAFVAVNNVWNDSYRIISGSDKMIRRKPKLLSSEKADTSTRYSESPEKFDLALRRIDGFSRLHTSVCQIFEVKEPDDTAELESSSKMTAQSLSHNGKANLCSCVQKMSMTLSLSIKQLLKYFKESNSQTTLDSNKLNEAIICLIGWSCSVKAKETKYDIITGPLQWYMHEKQNFDLSSFGKNSNESYPILGRLPKLLFRLEGLEIEMRKLYVIMTDLSVRDDGISRRHLPFLDQLTSIIIRGEDQLKEQSDFGKVLGQCIQIIDSRKNAMNIGDVGDIMLSDEDQADADVERIDFTWTGKRQMQGYAPTRKSRRISLRSRNETIDNWLTMDDDEFGSAQGEKYNDSDAFVDLEDFVVEG